MPDYFEKIRAETNLLPELAEDDLRQEGLLIDKYDESKKGDQIGRPGQYGIAYNYDNWLSSWAENSVK